MVHISSVHKILVHTYLDRKKFFLIKRIRAPNLCEPNLCAPSSYIFSENFDLWFTFFHSSQILREPVNHGPQITPAPLWGDRTFWSKQTRCFYLRFFGTDIKNWMPNLAHRVDLTILAHFKLFCPKLDFP